MAIPYSEGAWFAVPLEKGGYGVGIVARCKPKAALVVGYFFGPKRERVPCLSDLEGLTADDAVAVKRVDDLGITSGRWPIIGASADWDRAAWPMPVFTRTGVLTKEAVWRVRYSENDPEVEVSKERIPYDPSLPDNAGHCGVQFLELVLSDILDS